MNCTTTLKRRQSQPKADIGENAAATEQCLDWLTAIAEQRACFAIARRQVEPALVIARSVAQWVTRLNPTPLPVRLRPPA